MDVPMPEWRMPLGGRRRPPRLLDLCHQLPWAVLWNRDDRPQPRIDVVFLEFPPERREFRLSCAMFWSYSVQLPLVVERFRKRVYFRDGRDHHVHSTEQRGNMRIDFACRLQNKAPHSQPRTAGWR